MTEDEYRRGVEVVATEAASYHTFTASTIDMWSPTITPYPTEDYTSTDTLENRYEDYDAYFEDEVGLVYKVEIKSRPFRPDRFPDLQINDWKVDKLIADGIPLVVVELFPGYGKGYFWVISDTGKLEKTGQYSAPSTVSTGYKGRVWKSMYVLPHKEATEFTFDPDEYRSKADEIRAIYGHFRPGSDKH